MEKEDKLAERQRIAREILEEISTAGVGPDTPLEEYIKILTEYSKDCSETNNYKEGMIVEHVLKKLAIEEEYRHVNMLNSIQEAERAGVEEVHMMEFYHFDKLWNERIDEFELQARLLEESMMERHLNELNEFREMFASRQTKPKFSKALLNMKKIQETLAKQKQFTEAYKVKLKIQEQEEAELSKIREAEAESYSLKEAHLQQRQCNELNALRKRIERGRVEIDKQRRKELERLILRYQNVKRELEGQQNIIRARTGNLLKNHMAKRLLSSDGSPSVLSSAALSSSISIPDTNSVRSSQNGSPKSSMSNSYNFGLTSSLMSMNQLVNNTNNSSSSSIGTFYGGSLSPTARRPPAVISSLGRRSVSASSANRRQRATALPTRQPQQQGITRSQSQPQSQQTSPLISTRSSATGGSDATSITTTNTTASAMTTTTGGLSALNGGGGVGNRAATSTATKTTTTTSKLNLLSKNLTMYSTAPVALPRKPNSSSSLVSARTKRTPSVTSAKRPSTATGLRSTPSIHDVVTDVGGASAAEDCNNPMSQKN